MKIKKCVMQTLGQLAAWGILLLIAEEIFLILNVRGLPTLVQIFYYFGIPFVAGVVICFIKNKVSFKLIRFSKYAIYLLLVRIAIILLFLLLGAAMESLNARNWLANYLPDGEYMQAIASFLGSFNVYLIISLFPLAYGVTDFLFVEK